MSMWAMASDFIRCRLNAVDVTTPTSRPGDVPEHGVLVAVTGLALLVLGLFSAGRGELVRYRHDQQCCDGCQIDVCAGKKCSWASKASLLRDAHDARRDHMD